MKYLKNYLCGQLCPPQSDVYLDNFEPATGKIYSQIPDSDHRDVQKAVEAAQAAFPMWASIGAQARSNFLNKIADGIEARLEEFAYAESMDSGKPISVARTVDIPRAVTNFRFFATAILHFSSESHFMEAEKALNVTLRQPIGVVGCISPWNLPLYLFSWKIAPALAAGNCVVAKPSELTPMTAFLLSEVCIEANLPAGVLNILHGLGSKVGQSIVEHIDIKAISFTGGTATGRHLAVTAAPLLKKLSLELGGKNPALIFADCDFEKTVAEIVRASFSNNGQICLCASRIYVEKPIYEAFKNAFVERVKKLKTGNPYSEETDLGAVVSLAHLQKVKNYIDLAQTEGGKLLCGGKIIPLSGGYFLEPTVFEGLPLDCRSNQEEIFGPVVSIAPFDTEADALRLANGTNYGLAASVWTQHLGRSHRLSAALEFGIVWVNCWMLRDLRTPFGGSKQSGMGREGGLEALRFFTETKNICVKY